VENHKEALAGKKETREHEKRKPESRKKETIEREKRKRDSRKRGNH